jgi:hypothetical protein
MALFIFGPAFTIGEYSTVIPENLVIVEIR